MITNPYRCPLSIGDIPRKDIQEYSWVLIENEDRSCLYGYEKSITQSHIILHVQLPSENRDGHAQSPLRFETLSIELYLLV